MFGHNNILAFIFSILPALIYGFIVFIHSPKKTIQLNKLWIYTIIGFLSITFFNFFTFIFPEFQVPLFREFIGFSYINGELISFFKNTMLSVLFLAIIQVALLEEFSKWMTFKCGDLIRGRNTLRDHPYAIMFYTTMVAAGFASIENTEYAVRALSGGFGPDADVSQVLFVRSISTVIMHMICGIVMGYYIALGAKSHKLDRVKYNFIGLVSATILHGLYDFTLMYGPLSETTAHWPSAIIVVGGLVLAYFMATDLKYRKIYKKKTKK
jgi:RsiW-degrading membrane proteinase PrsW (M82 family)